MHQRFSLKIEILSDLMGESHPGLSKPSRLHTNTFVSTAVGAEHRREGIMIIAIPLDQFQRRYLSVEAYDTDYIALPIMEAPQRAQAIR